jgi:hypothetical protein
MTRRLKVIAAWINANRPELCAEIERGYCNTDRQVGRLRWPGKGRHGNRIKVFKRADKYVGLKSPQPLLDHNAAETYRHNDEVERWLSEYLNDCMNGKHRGFFESSLNCTVCCAVIKPKRKRK